jgi:tritrans,polycis-undecaprenyl-diphosphate synthase [geranylgeranyl-diphosphate specific]
LAAPELKEGMRTANLDTAAPGQPVPGIPADGTDLRSVMGEPDLKQLVQEILLWPAYAAYERALEKSIENRPLPNHVGVILDGNRRFAIEARFGDYSFGHDVGAKKVRQFLIWCLELGLKRITLFALSTENFSRPRREVDHIMSLIEAKLYELAEDEIVHEKKVRIQVVGQRDLLPDSLTEAAKVAEEATASYQDHYLYVAVAYGGRAEILEAIRSIMQKVASGNLSPSKITEATICESLYVPGTDRVDLVIRTSGEKRISNFLLWQSTNSLLCFLDVYWPAIRRIDLLRAIRLYQKRRASEEILD